MRDFAGLLLVLICLAAAGAAMSGRAAAHAALTQALPADGAVIAIAPAELSLLATGYGKIPLAKLGLVAVLLGLAAVNRYRLTGRAGAAQPLAARQLRRMIAAEIVVALAILGTAALWRFTPPPRALAIAAAQPATLHIHAEKAMADISVTPGCWTVELEILVSDFELTRLGETVEIRP